MGVGTQPGIAPPHPRQTLIDRFVLNTVRDERGVRLRPLRGGQRRVAVRGLGRLPEFDGVRRGLVPRVVRYPMFGLVALLLVGSLGLLVSWFVPWGSGAIGSVGMVMASGSLLLLLPFGFIYEHLDDRASVRAMLAARMCLRCAYDLEGAPVDGAGVCVCPECGAAWRRGA